MPNFSELFLQPNPFALSTVSAILKLNGPDALGWEPATIRHEIEKDFGVAPSQLIMDKVQAGMALLTTDQFYTYWEPFEEFCHVLNGYEADFELMRPPTPEEMAWAVVESHLIDSEEDPKAQLFSGEVKAYIATILLDRGFYKSPEALQFVDMSAIQRDPLLEFPGLAADIEDLLKVKLLRVRAHVSSQYAKLAQETRRYFPEAKLLPLRKLMEREIAWR